MKVYPIIRADEEWNQHFHRYEIESIVDSGADGLYLDDLRNPNTVIKLYGHTAVEFGNNPDFFIGLNAQTLDLITAVYALKKAARVNRRAPSGLWVGGKCDERSRKVASGLLETDQGLKQVKLLGNVSIGSKSTDIPCVWDSLDTIVVTGVSDDESGLDDIKAIKQEYDKPIALVVKSSIKDVDRYAGVVDELLVKTGALSLRKPLIRAGIVGDNELTKLVKKAHSL